jgi:hypothetical protein
MAIGRRGGRATEYAGHRDFAMDAKVCPTCGGTGKIEEGEDAEGMAHDPLTSKGEKIMKNMTKEYGPEKGKQVFYASRNAGKISGVDPKG